MTPEEKLDVFGDSDPAEFTADADADSNDAAQLVDTHRAHISKWFYECTPEIHARLEAMYVADERFRTNVNSAGEGLAEYPSAAIAARYAG